MRESESMRGWGLKSFGEGSFVSNIPRGLSQQEEGRSFSSYPNPTTVLEFTGSPAQVSEFPSKPQRISRRAAGTGHKG